MIKCDKNVGMVLFREPFFFNFQRIIQWSGEYSASGVMMYYKRENETETLFFPGPLKKPLTLMVRLKLLTNEYL